MENSLHQVLISGGGSSTDISIFLGQSGTSYDVYLGVALLERVGVDPGDLGRKMLIGRMINAEVPAREVSRAFGVSPRTAKNWGAALKSGKMDEIVRVFAGRGAWRKVTPEIIRYARQLYLERELLGRNYRQIIIDKIREVFHVSISTTIASALFRKAKAESGAAGPSEVPAPATSTASSCGMAPPNGLQSEGIPSSNSAPSVNHWTAPMPIQSGFGAGLGKRHVHHAGQAIFAAGMRGLADPFCRQVVGQILQGAVNIEQSKSICGLSLSHFTGAVVTCMESQRAALDARAGVDATLELYAANARLLADGPGRGDVFYFDPHTKEYAGDLRTLKGWCGRRHGVCRVINLDFFHTVSGRPCFAWHHSPYYDMRERFFMDLDLFNCLFEPDKRKGRTFIIDRGIYGLATLRQFGLDYFITWEKGYSEGGWVDGAAAIAFTRDRIGNDVNDLRSVSFECQVSPWSRDPSFRRIVARATRGGKTIEVSILTSHPHMSVEDVVWLIFRRWIQENDFKYLDVHFGINQLTSRASDRFEDKAAEFEDRPVDSPKFRELRASVKNAESKLGNRLARSHKIKKELEKLEIKMAQAKGRMEAARPSSSKAEKATSDARGQMEAPGRTEEPDQSETLGLIEDPKQAGQAEKTKRPSEAAQTGEPNPAEEPKQPKQMERTGQPEEPDQSEPLGLIEDPKQAGQAEKTKLPSESGQTGEPNPAKKTKRAGGSAGLADSIKDLNNEIRRKKKALDDLKEDVAAIEGELEPLDGKLCEATRQEQRMKLLIDGGYRLLDTRRKAFMDALRVTASNVFRNVHERFRVIYGNHREDHALLRTLSRCGGTVRANAQEATVTLWLPGSFQKHQVQAFRTLLEELEEQTNKEAHHLRPIRLRLAEGPQPLDSP